MKFLSQYRAVGGGSRADEVWMDFTFMIHRTSQHDRASFGSAGEDGITLWRRQQWWSNLSWSRSTQSHQRIFRFTRALRIPSQTSNTLTVQICWRTSSNTARSLIIYSVYHRPFIFHALHRSSINSPLLLCTFSNASHFSTNSLTRSYTSRISLGFCLCINQLTKNVNYFYS